MAGAVNNDYISMINKKGSGYNIPVIVEAIVNSEIDPIRSNVTAKKETTDAAVSGLASLKSSAKLTQTAINAMTNLSDYSLATSKVGTLSVTASDSSEIRSFTKTITELRIALPQIHSVQNFTADPFGAGTNVQTLTITATAAPHANYAAPISVLATDNVYSLAARLSAVPGLTAEVIDPGGVAADRFRLLITSEAGAAGAFTITSNLGVNKMTTAPHAQNSVIQTARNASFKMDNIPITRGTNTIDDLLDGVTVNLLADDTTGQTKITSTLSSASVQASVENLIKELNFYKADMAALGFVDANGDADGELAQNSYLRSAERQFQKLISTPILGYTVSGERNRKIHFVDFGVKTARDGTLVFDKKTFDRTFAKEPDKFDALTLNVQYSDDPNVQVFATATSTMPTGEHQFTNHQRVNPTSSTSSISGFRSFNDVLVAGSAIRFQSTSQHGTSRDITTTTRPDETVAQFAARLNDLPDLTAQTITDEAGNKRIAFSIPQPNQGTDTAVDAVDTGDTLTMSGSLSNAITGVAQIHDYRNFNNANETIPQQFMSIRVGGNTTNFTTAVGGDLNDLRIQLNNIGGISAQIIGGTLRLSANSTGTAASFTHPSITRASGGTATEVVVASPVTAVSNSIGAMSNHNSQTNESWQDVVDVGNFTRGDQNNNDSNTGVGGATYSSPSYTGFQFVTNSDQTDCKLYVGRSVKTLVSNFFTDALQSSATHATISRLYSERSSNLDKDLTKLDLRQAELTDRYTMQFAAMEKVVTAGGSTSEYLDSMVASWNKS
jgi:flagellar hook-associated protein 2